MYRIRNGDGKAVFESEIYSECEIYIGQAIGMTDPQNAIGRVDINTSYYRGDMTFWYINEVTIFSAINEIAKRSETSK